MSLQVIFQSLVSLIIFIIIFINFKIWIAITCIICTVLSTYLNNYIFKYQMKRNDELALKQRQVIYFNLTCFNFEYGKDIRTFNLKNTLLNKYNNKAITYLKVIKNIQNKQFLIGFFELLLLLLQDGISYMLIIKSYFDKTIDLSMAALYLTSIVTFTTVIRSFINECNLISADIKDTTEYFKLMDYSDELLSKYKLIEIDFKNVWFKYPSTDKYILKDLNFKINKGEKLAIVGTNGAGKSTIVKLICGFFKPDKG